MRIRRRPRGADSDRESFLLPQRWIADADLAYRAATNAQHPPGCPRLPRDGAIRTVAARSALELTWAAFMCACGPDVTLTLGGDSRCETVELDGKELATSDEPPEWAPA
jgi:hypothetical protein